MENKSQNQLLSSIRLIFKVGIYQYKATHFYFVQTKFFFFVIITISFMQQIAGFLHYNIVDYQSQTT